MRFYSSVSPERYEEGIIFWLILCISKVTKKYKLLNAKLQSILVPEIIIYRCTLNQKTVTKYFERLYLVVGGPGRWHQSKTYFPLQETCKTWKKIFQTFLSSTLLNALADPFICHFPLPKLAFLMLFVLLTMLALYRKALFRGWFYRSKIISHLFCCILADWEVFVTMHVTTEPLLTSGNPCRCVCNQ